MKMGSNAPARRTSPKASVASVVFLILAAVSVAAFGVTHNVVAQNDDRLLRERAGEVTALLQNALESSYSRLELLAVFATLPDQTGFAQGAGALSRVPGTSVAVLTEANQGFVVASAVGGSLVPGQPAGERTGVAARALEGRVQAADLVKDGGRTKLVFAVAAPAPARVVALLESDIDPSRPLPRTPGSPFSEMSGALYAAPTADPARLVLTSERDLPLAGHVLEVPFTLGAERWTLAVRARTSLSGSFPTAAPWILLGAGLVAALLTAAVVQTLARRQDFARALVDARTEELETTHRFLERLLMSGPAVVIRASLSGPERRISYVSPNVDRILGLERNEIMRVGSLLPYVHPDDVEVAQAASGKLVEASPDAEVIEFRIRRPDGSDQWVSALSVADVDEDGKDGGVFVYITDVSTRRAAEEALRGAQLAAEAANRSKSEFLSRMSHELRTPLNAVLGFSQLLKMQALPGDDTEPVDQILKGGRHLLDLIDEVLDITRIETGRLLLSPEPVLVSELVRESTDLVRSLADQRQITLIVDETGMSDYIFADRQRSKQVLLNLLSNAVKYNHARGSVAVSCSALGLTRIRISVADTGPGIRLEQMDRLFAPFDRLDAGSTDIEGTGIGLALSKNLAEAMGGALVVESSVGRGSTFSFDLPRVEGPVERYERLQPEPPVAVAATNGQRHDGPAHKLLHIEDNPSNLRLIERILSRRENVVVVSAMQGRFGIELARQHQPALILLDLHLPDISGEEILHRLREDPATSSIPVVMVTADATTGQVQRLLSAGAAAYLTKPLDVAMLLEVIDGILANA
jgi:PAS domain S-box-containing protein